MINTPELRLRRIALGLTVLLGLQLAWGGARVWLLPDPEPIAPAESSLQVGSIAFAPGEDREDLAARPVFWQGRQPYVAAGAAAPAPRRSADRDDGITDLKLLGVYAAGPASGIIVADRGEQRRLRLNEEIKGWTFTMMSEAGAIFENGDETRVLRLEHAVPAAGRSRSQPTSRAERLRQARSAREAAAARRAADASAGEASAGEESAGEESAGEENGTGGQ